MTRRFDAELVADTALFELNGHRDGLNAVDWFTFWDREITGGDFLVEPFLARGRQHAIYAEAKAGKSLLLAFVAARLATGQAVLSSPASDPVPVLYLDYEMTEDDLEERLTEFGYGPASNLSNLAYVLYPDLPPLDTPEGGKALIGAVDGMGARLVCIDTFSRAVKGGEQESDTYRAFARYTGIPLRERKVTVARNDHEGKDKSKGQRGSSAKDDDVEVVWRLERGDEQTFTVDRRRSRLPWIPSRIPLKQTSSDGFELTLADTAWPAGTADCAALLDQYGVPLDATTRDAIQTLRRHNSGRRRSILVAALRYRRDPKP
jgi:hypothetical protein